jgi:LuxR family maltose regulon positive regulatory protein
MALQPAGHMAIYGPRGHSGRLVNSAKVHQPALAAGTVVRSRVNALLELSVRRPLTVLQATTGYGKTTALSSWLASSGRPAAWLSLDGQDDDSRALMAAIVQAFEAVLDAGALNGVRQLLDGGADPVLTCLPLLAEIVIDQASDLTVLVLDDYAEIHGEPAQALIRALLDTLAPVVPVLISSRTKPPVRLSRRLAARQATVIGVEQLAFTVAETERLLNGVGDLGLSAGDLDAVEHRVHGWPLGLIMLLLALQGRDREAGAGEAMLTALAALSDGRMINQVVSAVLDRLPAPQRRLRLYTSVLDRVHGPLASALLEDPAAATELEHWRQDGQFIVSDGRAGGWLACHRLVRETLMATLVREEPGIPAVLHRRASLWFEQNEMVDEAIHHALEARDGVRLEQLLARHGLALVLARRPAALRQALASAPVGDAESSPLWEALSLLVGLIEGSYSAAAVQRAWALHAQYADNAEVGVVTAIIVSSPLVGDVEASIAAGEEAMMRFGHLAGFSAAVGPGLAACLLLAGRFSEVRATVEPLVTSERVLTQTLSHSYLSWVTLVEGDRDAAEIHARQALALLETQLGNEVGRVDVAWVRVALADALRVNGRLVEARVHLDRALNRELQDAPPTVLGLVLMADAELALAEGDRPRAAASSSEARQLFAGCGDVGSEPWRRLSVVDAGLAAPKQSAPAGSMLTAAEMRVLKMLAVTPNRYLIARELYLSESTVKTHLRRIYKRLGVSTREQALAVAEARRLLE